MNKEQLPKIEKEKELTLEDVKDYFEEEKDYYLNRARLIDRVLHLRAAERLKRIAGYEKIEEDIRGKEKTRERIPGLLENFGKEKYEDCLVYIEEILGDGGTEQAKNALDLINHKEYGPDISLDRNEDIEKPEYQERKNYLRKLADALTGAIYKKRKTELDEPLSPQEIENEILASITAKTGKNLIQVEEELGEGNYREIFEFLDDKTHDENSQIVKARKEENKEKIKSHQEILFKWRRHRRYFLNLQEEKEK